MSQPDPPLTDPIAENRALQPTESRVAIAGHPLHAMLVAFPIALGFCVLAADLLFWWTGDGFWPVAAGWAAFGAFVMGVVAGITGTPAAMATLRADALSPRARMVSALGPIKVMPASTQASTKSGFSESSP